MKTTPRMTPKLLVLIPKVSTTPRNMKNSPSMPTVNIPPRFRNPTTAALEIAGIESCSPPILFMSRRP